MEQKWSPGEEITAAFRLRNAVVHNNASINGSGPVTVLTDSPQWSYAVAFQLQTKARQLHSGGAPLVIQVETTVESGRIGILFVADDMQTVLSTTAECSQVDGPSMAEILVNPAPDSGWLMIRNHAFGGKPSKCQVRSIRAFRGKAAVRSSGGFADLLQPGTGSIDLFTLSAAVQKIRAEAEFGGDILATLRRKWSEVPAGLSERRRTTDLAAASDEELWALWTRIHREATTGEGYSVRGWYHELYKSVFAGKRVLDVGSGLGIDGLAFARHGACMTFVDIVQGNLEILRRLCRISGIEGARFHYMEDLRSLDTLAGDFDVIWCQGSMITAPFSFASKEAAFLLCHLPVGGRWVERAYPRERWERDGRLTFRDWGNLTDGEGTPWMEWCDLDRLLARLRPAEFEVVLHFNFHQNDFNWFDLVRTR